MRCIKAFGERIAARDPDRQTAGVHKPRLGTLNRRNRPYSLIMAEKRTIMPQATRRNLPVLAMSPDTRTKYPTKILY